MLQWGAKALPLLREALNHKDREVARRAEKAIEQIGHGPDRPVTFAEVFATLYRNLGLDPSTTTINDPTGRPQHVIEEDAIKELI